MPWTLYRYILRELLKLLLLTTFVLVVFISFATAIRPMADGLLSPALLAKFVLFTAPTVLGFALPFAGAFASTLVFIRMASDNEILACSASGVSYRRILAPVLALGLVLTGVMLYLSNFVVPSFYTMAEKTIDDDLVSVLVTQLNQNQPFEVRGQNLVIYADEATEFPPQEVREGYLPMKQFVELKGVAVGEIGSDRRILQDVTAESAVLLVFGDEKTEDTWVQLAQLKNVVRYDSVSKGMIRVETVRFNPIRVPSPLNDNPKVLSTGELRDLERNPQRYEFVGNAIQNLMSALATESLRRALVVKKDRAVLNGPVADDRYVLSAPEIMEDGSVLRLTGTADNPIRLEWYTGMERPGAKPVRTYLAESALVKVHTNPINPEPTIDMELQNVQIHGDTGGPVVGEKLLPIRLMTWPEVGFKRLQEYDYHQLQATALEEEFVGSDQVGHASARLDYEIEAMKRAVVSERNVRAASAVSCSLLLLLGAALSIRMKGQMPLVVYFWSFLLAIVTLIIINSGANVAGGTQSITLGMVVLWSGNALLLTVISIEYLRLSRN